MGLLSKYLRLDTVDAVDASSRWDSPATGKLACYMGRCVYTFQRCISLV